MSNSGQHGYDIEQERRRTWDAADQTNRWLIRTALQLVLAAHRLRLRPSERDQLLESASKLLSIAMHTYHHVASTLPDLQAYIDQWPLAARPNKMEQQQLIWTDRRDSDAA